MSNTIRECQVCHCYIAMPGKQCCRKCWRSGLWLDPLLDALSAANDAHAEPAHVELTPEPEGKPEPRQMTKAEVDWLIIEYGLMPERRRPYKRFGKRGAR